MTEVTVGPHEYRPIPVTTGCLSHHADPHLRLLAHVDAEHDNRERIRVPVPTSAMHRECARFGAYSIVTGQSSLYNVA